MIANCKKDIILYDMLMEQINKFIHYVCKHFSVKHCVL